jgi:hypothetical protein
MLTKNTVERTAGTSYGEQLASPSFIRTGEIAHKSAIKSDSRKPHTGIDKYPHSNRFVKGYSCVSPKANEKASIFDGE